MTSTSVVRGLIIRREMCLKVLGRRLVFLIVGDSLKEENNVVGIAPTIYVRIAFTPVGREGFILLQDCRLPSHKAVPEGYSPSQAREERVRQDVVLLRRKLRALLYVLNFEKGGVLAFRILVPVRGLANEDVPEVSLRYENDSMRVRPCEGCIHIRRKILLEESLLLFGRRKQSRKPFEMLLLRPVLEKLFGQPIVCQGEKKRQGSSETNYGVFLNL